MNTEDDDIGRTKTPKLHKSDSDDNILPSPSGYHEILRIPKSRIGVLVGPEGKTKRRIEKGLSVRLEIDSSEGSVIIHPFKSYEEMSDPTAILTAKSIIQAIGRGMSEQDALHLLHEDTYLEIIELQGNPHTLRRIRGRLIGERGKSQRIIETNTSVKIAVYGDTVALIGELEDLQIAKQAIQMLLKGARHATVYRFLENIRIRRKMGPPQLWKERIEFRESNR